MITIEQQWHQERFLLSEHRMMYWPSCKTLIVSDLHLGKTGHFRKSGIAMPQQLMKEDLLRLFHCLQYFKPERLLIVGDLVHSHANKELDLFCKWRKDLQHLHMLLIRGNHDILDSSWYLDANITVATTYEEAGIKFMHEPPVEIKELETPLICGHIHPGIRIQGIARQSLRFPCFYFGESLCILPAFGLFTGTYSVKPRRNETVVAITPGQLIRL